MTNEHARHKLQSFLGTCGQTMRAAAVFMAAMSAAVIAQSAVSSDGASAGILVGGVYAVAALACAIAGGWLLYAQQN